VHVHARSLVKHKNQRSTQQQKPTQRTATNTNAAPCNKKQPHPNQVLPCLHPHLSHLLDINSSNNYLKPLQGWGGVGRGSRAGSRGHFEHSAAPGQARAAISSAPAAPRKARAAISSAFADPRQAELAQVAELAQLL
jgi:hypothetical protein